MTTGATPTRTDAAARTSTRTDTAADAFTRTMSRVPGPVTVATTVDATGRAWGLTASSFTSLSLEPPLVLLCIDKSAGTHEAFTSAAHFLVNVLADDQSEVARRFAARGTDRFRGSAMTSSELGLPGLPDAAARLACSVHDVLDGGDHTILVGRVRHTHAAGRQALVYWDRTFCRPAAVTG
jgi:flavin reductase (DIM6/NTAB) family NADH-FMN oxidoreductase RutF